MELMEKLAALVPRPPRVHLTRFHGVLGPHYKYRNQIVPQKPVAPALILAATQGGSRQTSDVSRKKNLLGKATQKSLWHLRIDLRKVQRTNQNHRRH